MLQSKWRRKVEEDARQMCEIVRQCGMTAAAAVRTLTAFGRALSTMTTKISKTETEEEVCKK